MSDTVQVKRVETAQDFKAFFEFPWRLYADDPYWTPTLLSMRRETLDSQKNPSWEYMEGDYYIALRRGETVGTIAAFVNKRHNEYHHENIAWFGFFEVQDDQEAANALLETASQWARDHGYDALRGPQSFTTHEECGLLVDGFTRPVMLMPYNKPYFGTLVENAGFEKVMDVHSFYLHLPPNFREGRVYQRFTRATRRILDRNDNISIRKIDKKNMHADFELFKSIYNQAWEANWGFVPMTDKELEALVDSLAQFFDPELAFFVEVDGEAVGFLIAVPDFNQVLWRAYPKPGTPEFITLLKALWHWKIRPKIDLIRIPLMGVRTEYRNMGLDLLLYERLYDAISSHQLPYNQVDAGWVLETNQALSGILSKAGMERYRTHRFYEKPV